MNKDIKKTIGYGIPALALIIFLAVMLSGPFLKQSFGRDDNFTKYLNNVHKSVDGNNWSNAGKNVKRLLVAWKKIQTRVQFSEERNQMNDIDVNLARLKGAVEARDKKAAIIEISEAHEHWKDMGS